LVPFAEARSGFGGVGTLALVIHAETSPGARRTNKPDERV
jgi:hypothetical protein